MNRHGTMVFGWLTAVLLATGSVGCAADIDGDVSSIPGPDEEPQFWNCYDVYVCNHWYEDGSGTCAEWGTEEKCNWVEPQGFCGPEWVCTAWEITWDDVTECMHESCVQGYVRVTCP